MAGSITIDPDSITTREVTHTPALALTRDQTRHIFKPICNFDLPIGTTPATRTEIIHVAEAAGNVLAFGAGMYEAGATATGNTFDLLKNGTTVLSAAVSTATANGDRTVIAGTISAAAYVAGDVFTVALTTGTTGGAQGPFCRAVFDELCTA